MHAAAAAVRAAGRAAEQLGDQLPRRHALGQRVAVAAVRAEDHVVGAQVGADADGDRLLADVGVAGPVDQAALVRTAPGAPRTGGSGPSAGKATRAGSFSGTGGASVGMVGRVSSVGAVRRRLVYGFGKTSQAAGLPADRLSSVAS